MTTDIEQDLRPSLCIYSARFEHRTHKIGLSCTCRLNLAGQDFSYKLNSAHSDSRRSNNIVIMPGLLERVEIICLMGGYPSKSNFVHLGSAKLDCYCLIKPAFLHKTDDITAHQPLLINVS
jgi:hypothetical protein